MWLPSPLTGPPPSCWRAASAWFCAGFGFLWWLFWAALAGAWVWAGAGAGAATPRAPANAAGDAAQRVEADRYQPWTTPEGIHMLRVAPAGAMHMSVLRCDNGRLVAAERGRAACADH